MIGVTCIMVSTIFSHAGVHKITYLNSSISDVCQIILIFSLLIKFIFILHFLLTFFICEKLTVSQFHFFSGKMCLTLNLETLLTLCPC